jgi:hypothetical protein
MIKQLVEAVTFTVAVVLMAPFWLLSKLVIKILNLK